MTLGSKYFKRVRIINGNTQTASVWKKINLECRYLFLDSRMVPGAVKRRISCALQDLEVKKRPACSIVCGDWDKFQMVTVKFQILQCTKLLKF